MGRSSLKERNILDWWRVQTANNTVEYLNLISESFDRTLNTGTKDILILGGFNYNMLSTTNNRMFDLMQEYNLKQLIDESTHFTESFASLIDLILARNPSNIITSGVYDTFIENPVRYHCPIIYVLKLYKCNKRRIWNYDRTDFNRFRDLLSSANWTCILDEPDKAVEIFNNNLIHIAENPISNTIAIIMQID